MLASRDVPLALAYGGRTVFASMEAVRPDRAP